MPILTEGQREEKIINYILLHQGCSKEEAYDALKDMLSRNTFFKDLPNLIKEEKIIMKHKNRRDTSLYVDKKNPLIYVPEQLEDFERAYIQLLDSSIKRIKEKDFSKLAKPPGVERIKEKDFSKLAKLLEIKETDLEKWSADDSKKYMLYEYRMATDFGKDMTKTMKLIKKNIEVHLEKIKHVEKYLAEYTERTADIRRVPTEGDKKILDHALYILKTIDIQEIREKSDYQTIHKVEVSILIHSCIRIYLVILDIITNLSIGIWPSIITNRENLKKLYAEVYTKIAEIQFQLSSSIASMAVWFTSEPSNEFFMSAKFMMEDGSNSLTGITQIYRALSMQTEIESVIGVINRIKTDIVEIGYHGGVDTYEEILHRNDELIKTVKGFERRIRRIRNN